MSRIRIGIEVELYCKPLPSNGPVLSMVAWERTHDPSVRGTHGQAYDMQNEFRTQTSYEVDLENMNPFLTKVRSDFNRIVKSCKEIEANESMGIHFHFSGLKKLSGLFSREAHDEIRDAYRRFAKTRLEKERLGGHTNPITGRDTAFFCKWRYDPKNSSDRYYAINYKPAWLRGGRKTIEFRFFPSTKSPAVLAKYCKFALSIVKRYEDKVYPLEHFRASDRRSAEEIEMKDLIC